MSKSKVDNIWSKLAILLLNIFVVSSGATAATIPLMIKSFPNIAQVLSKLSGNNSSEFTFICGAVIMLVLLFLVVWIGINYHKLQYQMNK